MITGISDSFCKVEVKQATGGGFYADVGQASTRVFSTPRQAAEAGNALGTYIYGSTIRLIDLSKFRG
jgi:hypothetical protein